MVTDRTLRGLIRRCIHQDPEERPSMEDIIEELEQLREVFIGSAV